MLCGRCSIMGHHMPCLLLLSALKIIHQGAVLYHPPASKNSPQFSRTLHPIRCLRLPSHQEQSFAIKDPLFVFTSPCICATLHPDAERTIRHPRNNKTTYDPQSCLTARINVTLMIRLVLNGSSFFPDRSCPNRHPHAESAAGSAVYE